MNTYKINKRFFAVVICAILGVLCLLRQGSPNFVYADTRYSILDDFADTGFDPAQFPERDGNYSWELIQLAETTDGEVVVYVYQPTAGTIDLRASFIRLSTGINDNAKWSDYELEYLGNADTLYKYRVKELHVKSDALRYYDIPCILRPWTEGFDEPTGNDNTISQVPYAVEQLWTASTVGGEVSYSMVYSEAITITDKYADCLYFQPPYFNNKYTLDCYVAFNTDIEMDKILEAEVKSKVIGIAGGVTEFVQFDDKTVVRYDEYVEVPDHIDHVFWGVSWWKSSVTHTWSKIQTVDEFKASSGGKTLSDTALENIKDMSWVVHFYDYDWNFNNLTHKPPSYQFKVDKATILRLQYVVDGATYNVGVIDNYQGSDWENGNKPITSDPIAWLRELVDNIKVFFTNYWYWFVVGAVGIVALIVLAPFLPTLLHLFISGIVWLFKGLVWLVSLPFKGIAALVRKIRDRGTT